MFQNNNQSFNQANRPPVVQFGTDGTMSYQNNKQKFNISNNVGSNDDSNLGYFDTISSLTLYSSVDIKIRGRIKSMEPMRTYKNAKGDGCVFSMIIIDSSQEPKNCIKASCFNEVAEKFHAILKVGQVYIFSSADIKPRNARWNNTKHEAEQILNKNTTIEASDDSSSIPEKTYDFTPIIQVADMEKYTELDILACVLSIGDERSINLKAGGTSTVREYTIYDESKKSITLNVWDVNSEGEPKGLQFMQPNNMVCIRGLKVNEFMGKNLSTTKSTEIVIAENQPSSVKRFRNFINFFKTCDVSQIESLGGKIVDESGKPKGRFLFKSLSEIEEEVNRYFAIPNPAPDGKSRAFFYNTFANLSYIGTKALFYLACATKDCLKKANDDGNGAYYCEKCQQTCQIPVPRFIGKGKLSDHTTSIWVSFGSQVIGEKLLGMSAKECWELQEQNEEMLTEKLKDRCLEDYNFVIMAKEDYYQNELKPKYSIYKADAPKDNYQQSIAMQLKSIQAYDSIEKKKGC